MLKLYNSPVSVCSVKVRFGLAEIGLEYEQVLINLSKGEQYTPEYLALNPDGVVPTLVDGDLVIAESSLILEYLDRYYNHEKLVPKGKAAATTTRHWLVRTLAIHAAINTLTFSTAGRDQTLASKTQSEIEAALAKMPDPVARLKRLDLLENGLSSPYVSQALGQLRRVFADMDRALTLHHWVSGEEIGMTDIALLSYVDRLQRLGFEGLWADQTPRISDWLARMQSRPSYAEAVTSQIDAQSALKTRQSGETYWPALKELWD